jgi:outer membrane lipoprotein SlyB
MTLLVAVVGCGPDYSPNTYSTAAVQQANKVDQGVIAGYREIEIRADGTVGAVTGGAAGGVLGAQEPDGGVITALSAIGGTLVGGIIGTSVEHAAGDTTAFEYIVRKTGGDLVAVAQKDARPLPIGLKVLVIEGKQARIVADYTVPLDVPAPSAAKNDDGTAKAATGSAGETPKDAAVVPAPAPQPAPAETQPVAATPSPAPAPQAVDPSAAQATSAAPLQSPPAGGAPPPSAPAADDAKTTP